MNRIERIIYYGGKFKDEVCLLSNDDMKIEDDEDYAEMEGKRKVVMEVVGDLLYFIERECIDNFGLSEGRVNEIRDMK